MVTHQTHEINILIFGDPSTASFDNLREPLSSYNPGVEDFLAQANIALRREISLLSQLDKASFLGKDVSLEGDSLLQEWAARGGTTHPVLRTVLTTASHLVDLLRYNKTSPDVTDPSRGYVLGSCGGLLAAAAATALGACKVDWIPLAVRMVCVIFRIAIYTASKAEQLTGRRQDDSSPESWTSVVRGGHSRQQDVLDAFHKEMNTPIPMQAYISASTPGSVTISGPPQTVKKLFASAPFRATGCTAVSIPIFAPYHASHLYTDIAGAVDWILEADEPSTSQTLRGYGAPSNLLSTKDGQPLVARDMFDLLAQILELILIDVLRWDTLASEVATIVPEKCSVKVTVIGGANALGKGIVNALRQIGQRDVSLTRPIETLEGTESASSIPMSNSGKDKIAIIGMSGRFPGAKDTKELWNVLSRGLDLHQQVPPDRFEVDSNLNVKTPYGCFIDQPGLFDPSFFHMSPREAISTDPMQRLALVCAYEALEMSGYVPNRTPSSSLGRAGTFFGQTIDDYREARTSQNIDPFYVTGGLRPFGPGRINYYYKFTGPSYVIDTACSSSLAAIHIACAALRNRECDMAVAGGTNVIAGSDMYTGLSRGQFLSKTGPCKTFDAAADGYCRADGVGTLVLKRLDDAMADRDPILGVILASATNHSSLAKSITQPHGPTQEALFRTILDQARVRPSEVDYIEMHGTGTQIGDSTEMRSVCNVFRHGHRSEPLYVGSLKANLGHSEAAAGVTAVIKSLLMFEHNLIPPHVGIKGKINHKFPDLEDCGIEIPLNVQSFGSRLKDEDRPRTRKILVNNFGAAGGNTSLLLEEPPAKDAPGPDGITPGSTSAHYPIPISGKTISSLNANKQRLLHLLQQNPDVSIADLSYTLTSRRQHYRHRFITVSSTLQDLENALLAPSSPINTPPEKHQQLATIFTFTGQGAIYPSVAHQLFHPQKDSPSSNHFRKTLLSLNRLSQSHNLPSFLPLLDRVPTPDPNTNNPNLPPALSPVQLQLGQVAIQMALSDLYAARSILPHAVVGHSLGEYAALYACGVLSASDTLLAVGRRAELIERFCEVGTHTMLAVRGVGVGELEDLVAGKVEVACINGPRDIVLGGPVNAVQEVSKFLADKGIKSTVLPVPFGCHTAQFDPVVGPFRAVVEKGVTFRAPRIPLLSPLLGRVVGAGEEGVIDGEYLARHLRERVDFVGAVGSVSALLGSEEGNNQPLFLELGPHPICAGMVRNILPGEKAVVPSLKRDQDASKCFVEGLAALYMRGLDVDWEEHNRDFGSKASCLASLPSYAFDDKNYWIDLVESDRTLGKGGVKKGENMTPRGPCTASVQTLVRESLDQEQATTAQFESDLRHPELYEAIAGHVINGVALCPSAVYADMAFTAAKWLYEAMGTPDFDDLAMDITDMEIVSPLVLELGRLDQAQDQSQQKHEQLRISATLTGPRPANSCQIEFSSSSSTSPTPTIHAKCTIILHSQHNNSQHTLRHLVTSRITHLQEQQQSPDQSTHRIHARLIYKLFRAASVDYATSYQGLSQVLMDSKGGHEAVARVKFNPPPPAAAQTKKKQRDKWGGGGGRRGFMYNPYWIDNLTTQLSGFVLNGHDTVDSDKTVYISNGWESLQILGDLEEGVEYVCWVRMEKVGGGSGHGGGADAMMGDVYVLRDGGDDGGGGGEIVCVVKGVRFHGVPRRLLKVLLAPPRPRVGGTSTGTIKTTVKTTSTSERPGGSLPPASPSSSWSVSGSSSPTEATRRGSGGASSPATSTSCDEAVVPVASTKQRSLTQVVLQVLSEELGVTLDDLLNSQSTPLTEMGVDSLMSLMVVGRLRESFNLEFPSSIFQHHDTIRGLIKFLEDQGGDEHKRGRKKNSKKPVTPAVEKSPPSKQVPDNTPHCATSVLLQGSLNPPSNLKIFLFPGGFGTSSSFAPLPPLTTTSLAVLGLNSPFIHSPESFTHSIPELAAFYLAEIRRRQPRGPYSLLGYSVGGVIAYEAARQLLLAGEVVERLYLVDSPCPLVIPPMPPRLIEFLDSIDRFSGRAKGDQGGKDEPPVKSMGSLHVTRTLVSLEGYMPGPLPEEGRQRLRTTYYVARRGVVEDKETVKRLVSQVPERDGKVMSWLLDERAGLGGTGDGWEQLVGRENLRVVPVEGNHFNIMKEPYILEWATDLDLTYCA